MKGPALTPSEIAMIRSVFRRHPEVTEVRLFGSRAKGSHTSRSDIDLALFGSLTPLQGQAIASELDDLPLPYKFDVQVFESIRMDALRDHIDRVGAVVYPAIAPQLRSDAEIRSTEEIEALFQDLINRRDNLWSAMDRIGTDELRALITLALREADGSYRTVANLFHVKNDEYRRFMDFLRRHDCFIDSRPFKKIEASVPQK